MTPKPSLERTSNGMAPRTAEYHVASRGAMPLASDPDHSVGERRFLTLASLAKTGYLSSTTRIEELRFVSSVLVARCAVSILSTKRAEAR